MDLLQTQRVLSTIRRIQSVRNEPGLMEALHEIVLRRAHEPNPQFGRLEVVGAFIEASEHPDAYPELVRYTDFINKFLEDIDEHSDAATDSILTAGDDIGVSRSAAEIYREHGIEPRVFSLVDIQDEYGLAVEFVFDKNYVL